MSTPNILIKTALSRAVTLINEGANPTESLRKTANEYDLNPEFTKRVGECLNVALHHNHFKHADDKAAEFPIADIPAVINDFYKFEHKTASQYKDEHFQSESIHSTLPDFNKIASSPSYQEAYRIFHAAGAPFMKEASAPLSADYVFKKSSNYIIELEKQATNAQIEKTSHELEMNALFLNLAQHFRKEAAARTSFGEFESQAFSKYGSAADEYIDLLHKYAAPNEARGVHDKGYIMFDDSYEVRKFGQFMDAVNGLSAVVKKAQEVKENLEFEKDYIATIYKTSEDLKNGVDIKKAAITDEVFRHLKDQLQPETKGHHNPVKGHMDHFEHQLIIQDLMIRDPILSKEDPNKVIEAYEQLLRVAPQIAKEKEVVRAILRKMVASQALSPFDVNQWIDAENNLSKQKIIRHTGSPNASNHK